MPRGVEVMRVAVGVTTSVLGSARNMEVRGGEYDISEGRFSTTGSLGANHMGWMLGRKQVSRVRRSLCAFPEAI